MPEFIFIPSIITKILPSIMIASSVSYTLALTNIELNAPNKNSSRKSLSTIFVVVVVDDQMKSVFLTVVSV